MCPHQDELAVNMKDVEIIKLQQDEDVWRVGIAATEGLSTRWALNSSDDSRRMLTDCQNKRLVLLEVAMVHAEESLVVAYDIAEQTRNAAHLAEKAAEAAKEKLAQTTEALKAVRDVIEQQPSWPPPRSRRGAARWAKRQQQKLQQQQQHENDTETSDDSHSERLMLK